MDDSRGLLRTVLLDQLVEVDAIDVLHRVIEPAVAMPVVEDRDGVRVAELAGLLDFVLEPHEVLGTDEIRAQQLQRGGSAQQQVLGEIHLAEATLADQAAYAVDAELLRGVGGASEIVDDERAGS